MNLNSEKKLSNLGHIESADAGRNSPRKSKKEFIFYNKERLVQKPSKNTQSSYLENNDEQRSKQAADRELTKDKDKEITESLALFRKALVKKKKVVSSFVDSHKLTSKAEHLISQMKQDKTKADHILKIAY